MFDLFQAASQTEVTTNAFWSDTRCILSFDTKMLDLVIGKMMHRGYYIPTMHDSFFVSGCYCQRNSIFV